MDKVAILKKALESESPPCDLFSKPLSNESVLDGAIWRFLKSWSDANELGHDQAVLFRQVLRWGLEGALLGKKLNPLFRDSLSKCGVTIDAMGRASAAPFKPDWITNDKLPEHGLDIKPVKRETSPRIQAEHYLGLLQRVGRNGEAIGFDSWKSVPQKEAAWFTITANAGSTSLIVLPTGMGKSQCFQLLPIFSSGLTVVVVPTVALAIDQYNSAKQVFAELSHVNPQFFAANDPRIDPGHVVEQIKKKQTRLVFTSPEACVTGRLKSTLEKAAKDGWLENFVIDEAHLVSSWGMYFRIDFQLLSGLRRKWMRYSNQQLKTYLYTATLTPQQKTDILTLFSDTGASREFIFQSLRPEQAYFDRTFDGDADQDLAIKDCIWHVPRPAIFYTTEVEKAEALYHRIKGLGFSRVGLFTGSTSSSERRELLDQWRDDQLDLMVATSAFGLGVDKQDVRAVVHCCMPEDLNRYYQEVGRSGRDGYSAVSILIPTARDKKTAEKMSPKLLDKELIQKRWSSMWEKRDEVNPDRHIYKVSPNDIRPGLLGDRIYSENGKWNKRLLLQLSRAQKIEITDVEYDFSEELPEPKEFIALQLQDGFNPASRRIGKMIKKERDQEIVQSKHGFKVLNQHLKGMKCLSRILSKLYGPETSRACGGCRWCRREGRSEKSAEPYEYSPQKKNSIEHVIIERCPRLDSDRPRRFKQFIRDIVAIHKIRRFVCTPEHLSRMLELFADALGSQERYRVDAVAESKAFHLIEMDRLAIFHVGQPYQSLINITGASRVSHLLCGDVGYNDVRYPLQEFHHGQLGTFSTPHAWHTHVEMC